MSSAEGESAGELNNKLSREDAGELGTQLPREGAGEGACEFIPGESPNLTAERIPISIPVHTDIWLADKPWPVQKGDWVKAHFATVDCNGVPWKDKSGIAVSDPFVYGSGTLGGVGAGSVGGRTRDESQH